MKYLLLSLLVALAACQNQAPYDIGCAGNPEAIGCPANGGGAGGGGGM
jgi:hypothetical protein